MDTTLGEKQGDQTQEKQSGGGIGQGINAINNLMGGGIKNPFGKITSGAVVQTARSGFAAFLASSVGLPILITLVVIVIFTVVVMGFGGVPGAPTLEPTPTIAPAETITPTPAP